MQGTKPSTSCDDQTPHQTPCNYQLNHQTSDEGTGESCLHPNRTPKKPHSVMLQFHSPDKSACCAKQPCKPPVPYNPTLIPFNMTIRASELVGHQSIRAYWPSEHQSLLAIRASELTGHQSIRAYWPSEHQSLLAIRASELTGHQSIRAYWSSEVITSVAYAYEARHADNQYIHNTSAASAQDTQTQT